MHMRKGRHFHEDLRGRIFLCNRTNMSNINHISFHFVSCHFISDCMDFLLLFLMYLTRAHMYFTLSFYILLFSLCILPFPNAFYPFLLYFTSWCNESSDKRLPYRCLIIWRPSSHSYMSLSRVKWHNRSKVPYPRRHAKELWSWTRPCHLSHVVTFPNGVFGKQCLTHSCPAVEDPSGPSMNHTDVRRSSVCTSSVLLCCCTDQINKQVNSYSFFFFFIIICLHTSLHRHRLWDRNWKNVRIVVSRINEDVLEGCLQIQ